MNKLSSLIFPGKLAQLAENINVFTYCIIEADKLIYKSGMICLLYRLRSSERVQKGATSEKFREKYYHPYSYWRGGLLFSSDTRFLCRYL